MGILKDPNRKKPRETRRHGGTLAEYGRPYRFAPREVKVVDDQNIKP